MYKPWAFDEKEKATIIPVTIGTKKILLIIIFFLFSKTQKKNCRKQLLFDDRQ